MHIALRCSHGGSVETHFNIFSQYNIMLQLDVNTVFDKIARNELQLYGTTLKGAISKFLFEPPPPIEKIWHYTSAITGDGS